MRVAKPQLPYWTVWFSYTSLPIQHGVKSMRPVDFVHWSVEFVSYFFWRLGAFSPDWGDNCCPYKFSRTQRLGICGSAAKCVGDDSIWSGYIRGKFEADLFSGKQLEVRSKREFEDLKSCSTKWRAITDCCPHKWLFLWSYPTATYLPRVQVLFLAVKTLSRPFLPPLGASSTNWWTPSSPSKSTSPRTRSGSSSVGESFESQKSLQGGWGESDQGGGLDPPPTFPRIHIFHHRFCTLQIFLGASR